MPDAPDTDPAPLAAPTPLQYRDPREDLRKLEVGRAWALTRAWFYAIFFPVLLVLFGSMFVAVILRGGGWDSVLPFMVTLVPIAWLAWASVRSVYLLMQRRVSHPFEQARDETLPS